jgi:hypothetical protein
VTFPTAAALRASLEAYDEVVARQGVARLPELDRWYRDELPGLIKARKRPHVTLAELAGLTEWKMARGVWRAPNLIRVKGNDPDRVIAVTGQALALVPHPTAPVAHIAEALDGVGPATASAVASATAPEIYPFFDELVAAQLPGLGSVAWTMAYYAKYAAALRARASELGGDWTPVRLERALWAHVGGKAGLKQARS